MNGKISYKTISFRKDIITKVAGSLAVIGSLYLITEIVSHYKIAEAAKLHLTKQNGMIMGMPTLEEVKTSIEKEKKTHQDIQRDLSILTKRLTEFLNIEVGEAVRYNTSTKLSAMINRGSKAYKFHRNSRLLVTNLSNDERATCEVTIVGEYTDRDDRVVIKLSPDAAEHIQMKGKKIRVEVKLLESTEK